MILYHPISLFFFCINVIIKLFEQILLFHWIHFFFVSIRFFCCNCCCSLVYIEWRADRIDCIFSTLNSTAESVCVYFLFRYVIVHSIIQCYSGRERQTFWKWYFIPVKNETSEAVFLNTRGIYGVHFNNISCVQLSNRLWFCPI